MPLKKYNNISCGDPLCDLIFKEFLTTLNKSKGDVIKIRLKKKLYDPADKFKKALIGLYIPEENLIYINPSKYIHRSRIMIVKTLIHELSHIIFFPTSEKRIRSIEEILWKKFNKNQKNILKSYIPYKEVKRNPK